MRFLFLWKRVQIRFLRSRHCPASQRTHDVIIITTWSIVRKTALLLFFIILLQSRYILYNSLFVWHHSHFAWIVVVFFVHRDEYYTRLVLTPLQSLILRSYRLTLLSAVSVSFLYEDTGVYRISKTIPASCFFHGQTIRKYNITITFISNFILNQSPTLLSHHFSL